MSGDDGSGGWQLTESDPGVFSELLRRLGVSMLVDDLYSLDAENLASLQPLHALIFLFKWVAQPANTPSSTLAGGGKYDPEFSGFFAHQTVQNACATLAVFNALGNIHPLVSTSQDLNELLSFTVGMDPTTTGMAVTSADWLREAHNALSPPNAVSLDGLDLGKQEKEDAYHFVVYIPVAGQVYELDGLKEHPVSHGVYQDSGEGWLTKARQTIEARIATYPEGALEFSLLALRDDPLPKLNARLEQLQLSNDHAQAAEIQAQLANETLKRERWAFENSLRKHNHLGFIHALTFALAKGGKLDDAKKNAEQAMKQRIERLRQTKGIAMEE